MATRPTLSQQRQIDALLAEFGPKIRDAFIAAIYNARGAISIPELIKALQAGDIERAVRLFRMDQAALFPLEDAVRGAIIAAGQTVAENAGLSGAFGFNGRHLRAEALIREMGATLVQGIQEDTLNMARTVITAGLQDGFTPQKVQRELTGTLNRLTGRREGGFLGLTTQQADSIISGRAKLASGDPALMREYLDLRLRDRRFDAMVKRAIRDGKPVSPADLEKIITAHKNKALRYRGEVIAKNEAFSAQAAGRDEAYRQALERADVASVTKKWVHGLSKEPRPDHLRMNGTVIDMDQKFVMDDGAQMSFPHDPNGGARHSISCRCTCFYRVILKRD